MEDRLFACGIILLAIITGSSAQLGVCGVAALNTKIVGGEDATPGSWPWQASLQQDGAFFCGGSLINNQYVLTAAHCFPGTSTSGLVVYLGRQYQQNVNPNEVSATVSQIIKHPSYNTITMDNDIALLELSSTITFTDYINPVCLPTSGSSFDAGTNCWVSGWGNIRNNVPLPGSQTLQEVSIPVVSNSDCSSNYSGRYTITDNMVCAGLPQGGKDSCQGDSGGPLVTKNTNANVWVQIGVVSFGDGCAQPNSPGVYARVSQYQDWINSQISTNQPGFVPSSAPALKASQFICLSVLSILHMVLSFFILS
ncbi:serine protease 33-like [Betta splendens]|uniref:Serine protease 33-like n=1 Tax=Betta splendens TaxID=158456 RepID=A0A6P7N431_BETSP|nr:serine protease 33-like [Betta splendens]